VCAQTYKQPGAFDEKSLQRPKNAKSQSHTNEAKKRTKRNTVNPDYNHLTWNLKIVAVVGSLPLFTGHLYCKTPMMVVVDRRLL
jgi:hypothetical protein